MRNVAITGVSGYIGGVLCRRIAQEAAVERIIGIDVRAPSFESAKFTFIQHDVSQPFNDIFIENNIDTAIHLAFIVLPIHDARKTHQINISGSNNFLAACANSGVKQVFYMGSNTEYGAFKGNSGLFTEDMPLNPNPDYPYAGDKAKVDLLFQDFAAKNPGICVTIGRTAPVTGPSGSACGLTALFLPVMVKAIAKNPAWQFIQEDDLAELVVRLLEKKACGVYNLAGDGALTYGEMIKKLRRPCVSMPAGLLYRGVQISWKLHLQKRSEPGALAMLQYPIAMSNEKVKKATDYQPRYTGPEAFEAFLTASGRKK